MRPVTSVRNYHYTLRNNSEERKSHAFRGGRGGPSGIVGIATGYGLDGPGSSPGGGKIFRTCADRPWSPPSLLYDGYRVFPKGKERPGREADTSLPSSAVVKKG
jgi:hypothetical protein